MRRKIAVLLYGMLLGLVCFFKTGIQAAAEEPMTMGAMQDTSAYLTMKLDTQVHIQPGTAWEVLGTLKQGQPAILLGKTEGGWLQIYYMGSVGYIPGDAAGRYEIPAPILWQKLATEGELKINALGDSITYGDKLPGEGLSFPHIVGERAGAVRLNNYGWNGSNVAGPHPDRLIDRYPAMERDANLILVLGGTNDYGGYNEIGTSIGKLGDLTPDTFYGSLNLMMCGLRQMYPEAEIVFMTPLRRVGYLRKNKSGYYLNQYAFAVQDMAAFWGIRVIDLFNEPELDFSSRQNAYLVDGLHPNLTGHALISACVYRRLFENP